MKAPIRVDRRSAIFGLFSVAVAGCSGSSLPVSGSRQTQSLSTASVALASSATPAASAGPLQIGEGSGLAPVFSNTYDRSLTTSVVNGYSFQQASDSSYVNVFDANQTFLAQYEEATVGANGAPTLRIVGNDGTFFSFNTIDVTTIPSDSSVTIGDATILYTSATQSAQVTLRGITVVSSYDANGNLVITGPNGTSTLAAYPGASASVAPSTTAQTLSLTRHVQDFVDTPDCRRAWNLAAALAAALLAALAALIACSFTLNWWGSFLCKIAWDKTFPPLVALFAATYGYLYKECYTGPQPPPKPIDPKNPPALPPGPVNPPANPVAPAPAPPDAPLPIHSNLPYAQ